MTIDLDHIIANASAWLYVKDSDTFLAGDTSADLSWTVTKAALDEKDTRLYSLLKRAIPRWSGGRCSSMLRLNLQIWADPQAIIYARNGETPLATDKEARWVFSIHDIRNLDASTRVVFDLRYIDLERRANGIWAPNGSRGRQIQIVNRTLIETRYPGAIDRYAHLVVMGVASDTAALESFRDDSVVSGIDLPTLSYPG